ncbi:MAG: hypothetical protein MR765_02375 [Tenericutes bacterium]|nr:hypothetical protein [Mycoplasmatota bacterium]
MNTLDVLKFIKSENKLESKININNCEFNVSFKGCYHIYINDVLKHFNIKKTDFTKVIKTIQKVIKLKKIDNLEGVDKKDIYLSSSDKCIKTLKRINKYLESIQDQDQFIQCTDITFFKELSQEELDKIPKEEQDKLVEIKSIIDSSNKWINIKYLSEVVTKCCDYISTHLTNELSYLLYSKYSLEDAKDKSYDIDSKYLVFLKQDLIQLPETKDLGLEETLTKYKELMKDKTITDPVLIAKLKYLVASKGPVSKCTVMSPVILPYQEIEHQEFNLTEHGIKLKDIKEIFKIADTANTFVCDQELWNKIISYDYSSVAKPKIEKPKKEPKPKVEKVKKEPKPKVKKEVKIEEEPKQEEVKIEEPVEVKVEEEKPKETKKKTTKKTTRVKRETKPKAKKEEPKVEMKEMSEADILNSISVDTSVLELDDVRQDFNLE